MRFEYSILTDYTSVQEQIGGIHVTWGVPMTMEQRERFEGGNPLGFIVCCSKSTDCEGCRKMLEDMGDDGLLEWINQRSMLFGDGVNIVAIPYALWNQGQNALAEYYSAPCRIEVWTVGIMQDTGDLVVFCGNDDRRNVACRKLKLICSRENDAWKETIKRGLFKKETISHQRAVICIESTDATAVYEDGAVTYTIGDCRFPVPITNQSLGKKLKFEGVDKESIEFQVGARFRDIYEIKIKR